MPFISDAWSAFMEPTLIAIFEREFNRLPNWALSLYNVMSSTSDDEDVITLGSLDPDDWEHYNNTAQFGESGLEPGYQTTFTHKTLTKNIRLKREWIDDNKYNLVSMVVQAQARSAAIKRQVDAFSVFNFAFTGSAPHLGADAVALCSASHPYSPDKTGTTQSNYNTLSLDGDNLDTVRTAMINFKDDKGIPVGVIPNLLIVPPALEKTAFELTESPFDPESANNAANINNKFMYMTSPYLTDTNAWFVVDTVLAKSMLHWFDRETLDLQLDPGQSNRAWDVYNAWMRYSFGWSDYLWVYGNNPS